MAPKRKAPDKSPQNSQKDCPPDAKTSQPEPDKTSTPKKSKIVKQELTSPKLQAINLPITKISKNIRNSLRVDASNQFINIDDANSTLSARRIADRIFNGKIRDTADFKDKFPALVQTWLQTKVQGKDLPKIVLFEYKRIISQNLCRINKCWYQYDKDFTSDPAINSLNLTFDNFWDDFVDLTRVTAYTTISEITEMDSKNMTPKKAAMEKFSEAYDVSN